MRDELLEVSIFDFDFTIYDGDSTLDFFLFCVRKYPAILRFLPLQLWAAVLFVLGRKTRTEFKSSFLVFMIGISDTDECVDEFWKKNIKKIKSWYLERHREDDIIISASPDFLLTPLAKSLGVKDIIATRVDIRSGALVGENCRGPEKLRRFREKYKDTGIREVYSDHMSDLPLMEEARKAFLVKGASRTLLNIRKTSIY